MRFLRFDEKELKELLATSHQSGVDNFGLEIFIYCVVECQNRRADWTQQIIDVFHRIDVGKKGAISLEDLKYANKMKDLELCENEMNEMIMAADLNKNDCQTLLASLQSYQSIADTYGTAKSVRYRQVSAI